VTGKWLGKIALHLALLCLTPVQSLASEPFSWQTLISATRGGTHLETLQRVNQRVNALTRISDERNWQTKDFWATPQELFSRGGGDCEDFAIAKFYLLQAHGFTASQLRLMFARLYNPASGAIEPHLVLLYQTAADARPLVLDNTDPAILYLDQRRDLAPSAAFDSAGYWAYTAGHWDRLESATIKPWLAVQRRWHQQRTDSLLTAMR
jgi:predicted transglutaminase-like cysteine proteinase